MAIKPLNALYAVVWFAAFTYFAWLVYSGELFRPDGNRIHIVAVMVAWVVEYLGVLFTSLLIFVAGLGVSALVLFSKSSD